MSMNKKDEIKTKVISGIADDIIDRNLEKRFQLMNGAPKKSPKAWIFSVSGVAAAVLVVFLGIFLFNIFSKQVPIYRGMSVSSPASSANVLSAEEMDKYIFLDNSGKGHGNGNKKPVDEAIKDSLAIKGPSEQMYYTHANSEILITIHIENPDAFEIMSFTLNGQKYTNYMFEPGSDLENLILKVNVGDVQGIVEYTIDAIKYVDGETIKDVRMEGDQTVCVGIRSDEQPTAIVSELQIGFDRISLAVTVTDRKNLIALTEGSAHIVLYDGETVLQSFPLAVNQTTTVTFDGLIPNTSYQYAVAFSYDDFNGNGFATKVALSESVTTAHIFAFESVTPINTSVSFVQSWFEGYANKQLTSLALYSGSEKLRDLSLDTTVIDGLSENTAYTLVATYLNGEIEETARFDFRTKQTAYTVKHYLENANEQGYTLYSEKVLYGVSGALATGEVLELEGFTSPTAQTKTITLDNEMVIEYYYTRISYPVMFVTNGGEAIAVTTLKYGQTLPIPEREGYTFGGWSQTANLENTDLTTMPAAESTFYAWWSEETKPTRMSYTFTRTECIITHLQISTVIPAYIGGLPVTGINFRGFAYHDSFTNVHTLTLGENIKKITNDTLYALINLRTLIIPETVVEIEEHAFRRCYHLVEVYNLSDCDLGFEPMIENKSLDAPRAVFGYSQQDFLMMLHNEKVYLIGQKFYNPINYDHWLDGYMPTELPRNKEFQGYTTYEIVDYAFQVFKGADMIDIPDCVTRIGAYAFADSGETITNIKIGAGVREIGAMAFGTCEMLRSVQLANLTGWVEVHIAEDGTRTETEIDFTGKFASEIADYFYSKATPEYSWYRK